MEDVLRLRRSGLVATVACHSAYGPAKHEPLLQGKSRESGTDTRLNFQSQPQLDDKVNKCSQHLPLCLVKASYLVACHFPGSMAVVLAETNPWR